LRGARRIIRAANDSAAARQSVDSNPHPAVNRHDRCGRGHAGVVVAAHRASDARGTGTDGINNTGPATGGSTVPEIEARQ
jgi:hypothetical protein